MNIRERVGDLIAGNKFHTSSAGVSDDLPILLQIEPLESRESDYQAQNFDLYRNQALTYNQFVWVYAAVSRIAEAASMVPLHMLGEKGEHRDDHPAKKLLDSPNFHTSMFELKEQTFIHLELQGNAYWFTELIDGQPASIEIIRPHEIRPHAHKELFVDYYIHRVNNHVTFLPADQVIHFKRYHPLRKYVGLSAIEAASKTLEMEDKRYRYDKAFFANNARPSGVLTTEAILAPEVQRRIERAWRDRFKGEENAHRTALLMGGVRFQSVGLAPKDTEFLNLRMMDRDELLAIFGVSTSNLGIVKDVNKSNAEAMYYMFMRDTIRPKLHRIQEKINLEFIERWYREDKVRAAFEEINVDTRDQILKEQQLVAKAGVMTVNEYRNRYLHLGPTPGGNTLMSALGAKEMEDLIEEAELYEYTDGSF